MKKNLIYAGMLLLGMMVATSCSNEEGLEQMSNNGKTIQAVIENATEARTSVSDNYNVLWTAGDAFSVFENDTKKATLTLSEGEGTTSGKFTIGDEVTLTEDMVALFPASDALSYTFVEEYTSQETDAPMSATFAEGKFTFNLLTAMVRVVVPNVPAGNVEMTLTSNDLILTGEAALSNGALGVPEEGEKSVAVKFKTTEAKTLTFDVPVPVQNYTNGLSVVVKSGDTEVLNNTTNAFDAAAGKLYLFGGAYVAADNAATTLQSALEAANGDVVVLTGDVQEVNVASLTLAQNTTATLDLNGKTLNLAAAEIRSVSEYGLTNNGTLTITNGTITSSEDYIAAIFNNGTLTITNTTINSVNRGIINNGTVTLDCDITSEKSNAVCGYGNTTNVITINGGTYTASVTTPKTSALRMDPREGGLPTGKPVDFAWNLTINDGIFVSEEWVALEMLNNYSGLSEAGWAEINGGTFTGSADHADIGGVAVQGITISSDCVLTNKIIKNQTSSATIKYDCKMNEVNLQDKDNHYEDVMKAATANE